MRLFFVYFLLCTSLYASDSEIKLTKIFSPQNDPTPLLYFANGGEITSKDSIFDKLNIQLHISPCLDFSFQVKKYVENQTPYLIGTLDELVDHYKLLTSEESHRPVIVMAMSEKKTYLVVRKSIKSIHDLKNKDIMTRKSHTVFLNSILKNSDLSLDDVQLIYTDDLIPRKTFFDDPSIAAVCVNEFDMKQICIDANSVGTGVEGTVDGAYVIASHLTSDHPIVKVLAVRQDYFSRNSEDISSFVNGYYQAAKTLDEEKSEFFKGSLNSKYAGYLTMFQHCCASIRSLEEFDSLIYSDSFYDLGKNELFLMTSSSPTCCDHLLEEILRHKGFPLDLSKRFLKSSLSYKSAPVVDEYTVLSKFTIKFEPNKLDGDFTLFEKEVNTLLDIYYKDPNLCFLVEGHSDTAIFVNLFLLNALKTNLITQRDGNLYYDSLLVSPEHEEIIMFSVKSHSTEMHSDQINELKDDKEITIKVPPLDQIANGLSELSMNRATNVKKWMKTYLESKTNRPFDNQIVIKNCNMSDPIHLIPRTLEESRQNMRVEVKLIKQK